MHDLINIDDYFESQFASILKLLNGDDSFFSPSHTYQYYLNIPVPKNEAWLLSITFNVEGPYNEKIGCFTHLINIQINELQSNFIQAINNYELVEEKDYALSVLLTRIFMKILNEIQCNIVALKLDSYELICADVNEEKNSQAFLIHYLLYAVICLYLDISIKYKNHISFKPHSPSKLLSMLKIKQPHPAEFIVNELQKAPEKATQISSDENTLIENKDTNGSVINIAKAQNTHKPIFHPISDDIRPAKKGVSSYHDLVRNSVRFASFEEKLFQNGYITIEYAYCGKHGYKNQLAIICHFLIDKNYFKKFNDSEKKKINNRDIVKFLNNRYDVDIDKQFRSYKNKPEERASFIESQYWLSRIPMC